MPELDFNEPLDIRRNTTTSGGANSGNNNDNTVDPPQPETGSFMPNPYADESASSGGGFRPTTGTNYLGGFSNRDESRLNNTNLSHMREIERLNETNEMRNTLNSMRENMRNMDR